MTDNTQPSSSVAPTDSHVRVAVPSNCVFYPQEITAIYARPFHIGDINAMATAKNAHDLPSFIRAIGKSLSVPVETLTQDDFQAVCYWHRINSYPRKPLTVTWNCSEPTHVGRANLVLLESATQEQRDMVEDAKAGIKNSKTLKTTDLTVHSITRERFDEISRFLKSPDRQSSPFLLMPPTVADMIEFAEITKVELRHKKINEMELNEENLETVLNEITEMTADDIFVRVASFLAPIPKYGVTLGERIKFVTEQVELNPQQFDAGFLEDLDIYEDLVAHGVSEVVSSKCKYRGCGHAVDITIDFDLFNFFPYV